MSRSLQFKRYGRQRSVPVSVSSVKKGGSFPDADSNRYIGVVMAIFEEFFPHNKEWEVRTVFHDSGKSRRCTFENMSGAQLFSAQCISTGHVSGMKGFGIFSQGVKLSMCAIDKDTGHIMVTILDELDGILIRELMRIYDSGDMDFLDPPVKQDKKKYRI